MSSSAFRKILIAVTVICIILTVAHVAYAFHAYSQCSIIYLISKELW